MGVDGVSTGHSAGPSVGSAGRRRGRVGRRNAKSTDVGRKTDDVSVASPRASLGVPRVAERRGALVGRPESAPRGIEASRRASCPPRDADHGPRSVRYFRERGVQNRWVLRDRGRRKRRGVAAAGVLASSRACRTRTLSSSINIATLNRSESSDAMVPAANGCTCDSKCAKRQTVPRKGRATCMPRRPLKQKIETKAADERSV